MTAVSAINHAANHGVLRLPTGLEVNKMASALRAAPSIRRPDCGSFGLRAGFRLAARKVHVLGAAVPPSQDQHEQGHDMLTQHVRVAAAPAPAVQQCDSKMQSPHKQWSKALVGVAAAVALAMGTAGPAAAATATPVALVASAEALVSAADTAWVLTSTALVLFMTIPGLACFYGGLVRQKNVLSILMQCLAITAVVTVQWTLFGYSMALSSTGMVEGSVGFHSFIGALDKTLPFLTLSGVQGTIPEVLWFIFQMTFAIITPALIVGAWAERIKFSALMLFTPLWMTAVYFPVCHMVWGGAGSFFGDMGVLDFAGGITVHITAGIAALVGCIVLGQRKENKLEPHNLALTLIGTGMLWVGWFGFNGGSALAADAAAAMAITVSHISAAVATITWALLDWTDPAVGKPTTLGAATGAIAGLAAITPAAGFVGPLGGLIMGIMSAVICRFFATTVKSKFNFDDTLDVFGVHGVGGFIGTLALSFLATPAFGGNQAGMSFLPQLSVQSLAAFSVAAYTAAATWAILKLCAKVCGGLRVTQQEEEAGLDLSSHDEECYVGVGAVASTGLSASQEEELAELARVAKSTIIATPATAA